MESDIFSGKRIVEFISNNFKKEVTFVKFLTSYEDKVALVKETAALCSGSFYILKIFLSKKQKEIHNQRTSIVLSLEQKGFLCSRFLVGVNGSHIQEFDTGEEKHLCLFYTYLEGQELENVADLSDPKTVFELGAFLGLLHKALEDVSHEYLEPDPLDPWLLCNVHVLRNQENLANIMSDDLRNKIELIINQAVAKLDLLSGYLKKGVIHGDFHTLNIIVISKMPSFVKKIKNSQEDKFTSERSSNEDGIEFLLNCLKETKNAAIDLDVSSLLSRYGIIDFGEMIYTFQILEVGRIIADLMVTIIMLKTKNTNQRGMASNLEKPSLKLFSRGAHDLCGAHLSQGESVEDESYREMMEARAQGDIDLSFSDITLIGGYILKGYQKTNSVSVQDIEVLKESVMVCLVQYILLVGKQNEDNSESFEYNTLCQKAAEFLLLQLSDVSPETLYLAWAAAALQC